MAIDKSSNWDQQDRRPIPDPTLLTTQALLREIAALKELVFTRLDGNDKAVGLVQETLNKSPSIAEMYAKHEQMFVTISQHIESNSKVSEERDRLYSTQFKASETAVQAALMAQKESTANAFLASEKAIVKAEDAQRDYNIRSNEFRGQLDDQAKMLMPRIEAVTMFNAYEDKLEDLKKRLESLSDFKSASEGTKLAVTENKQSTVSNWGILFGIVGGVVGIIGAIMAIAVFLKH